MEKIHQNNAEQPKERKNSKLIPIGVAALMGLAAGFGLRVSNLINSKNDQVANEKKESTSNDIVFSKTPLPESPDEIQNTLRLEISEESGPNALIITARVDEEGKKFIDLTFESPSTLMKNYSIGLKYGSSEDYSFTYVYGREFKYPNCYGTTGGFPNSLLKDDDLIIKVDRIELELMESQGGPSPDGGKVWEPVRSTEVIPPTKILFPDKE